MNRYAKNSGPRCACCGATYQPRIMHNGNLSQTCGKTACVARLSRKSDSNYVRGYNARAY